MHASETIAAAAFYLGLVTLCAGAILGARGAVEKKPSRLTVPLLAVGALAIAGSLFAYAHGPRQMLPF
jgi:uncharacterized membrane protein HdeD (DUF308 family)